MTGRDRSREFRCHATGRGISPILFMAMVFMLSVAVSACGTGGPGGNGDGSSTTTSSPGDSIAHPTTKNQIVLQVVTGGGFVPIEYDYTLVPEFSLYGDGRVVVPGPMIEIYPAPALPNLQTTVIPEESVQTILSATREAGLFDPSFDYGQPAVTDVGTTTITINADGTTYRSAIYALGMEQGTSGLTMQQQQARAAVNELRGKLMDLAAFEPGEIVWEQYQFSALAVYSQAVDPAHTPDTDEVQPNHLDWPLGDLSTMGEEVTPGAFRRLVLSGNDLAALQPLLGQATAITLWKSGSSEYRLLFRPLLPDETA